MDYKPYEKYYKDCQERNIIFWKSNKIMLNIINKVEKIFFSPESLEIYNSFKGKEYFITLGREELSTDTIINLLNKYLGDSQNIYVLF